MTKIDLIAGFLGAGKTTFIRRYAARLIARGERVLLIENEFGAAGVDTAFLQEDGFDVSQLTGGCICCGQKVNFHNLIVELADHADRIIIEPSGIFNMDDFWDVADSPPVREKCEIGAVIMVADPAQDDVFEGDLRDIAFSQVISAGAIVMSKTQKMPKAQVADYIERLNELALTAGRDIQPIVLNKAWDDLADADYDALSKAGSDRFHHERKFADHSALFSSVTLRDGVSSEEKLNKAIASLQRGDCGRVLRIKGAVEASGRCFSINCTPECVSVEPAEQQSTMLNIIGERLNRKLIKALFA